MSRNCMMRRARSLTIAPVVLGLGLLGGGCRNEAERAEGTVRDQAKEVREKAEDVREKAGEVRKESRELGQEVRELQARHREAWLKSGQAGNYSVEFSPDGAVVAAKATPPTAAVPPDEALTKAVNDRLAGSKDKAVRDVTATAKGGVVTLRGTVPNISAATTAVDEAIKTEGVSKVISHVDYGM